MIPHTGCGLAAGAADPVVLQGNVGDRTVHSEHVPKGLATNSGPQLRSNPRRMLRLGD